MATTHSPPIYDARTIRVHGPQADGCPIRGTDPFMETSSNGCAMSGNPRFPTVDALITVPKQEQWVSEIPLRDTSCPGNRVQARLP